MMPKTITASTGIATTKMSAAFTLIVKAMIIAPKTMKGERRKRRRKRLTPFCTWLMSEVMRVMRVPVPALSRSENPKDWMWSKRVCRIAVDTPTAAFAAKYWAVIEAARPRSPSKIRIMTWDMM